MAHLRSKHTLTVNLSNFAPTASHTVYYHRYAIQGNTTVTFVLSDVEIIPSTLQTGTGIQGIYTNYGDGSEVEFIPGTISDSFVFNLPLTAINHTYFQVQSAPSALSAVFNILYQPNGSTTPLSATHNVEFLTTSENILDRNLEILNTQIFTIDNDAVPIFNLETDENIIYPFAYYEVLTAARSDQGVFLATDPEDIDTDAEYLSRTEITLTSAVSTYGFDALSGSGFTLQGRDKSIYTIAFAITGDEIPVTYTQNTTSFVLSSMIDVPFTTNVSLLTTISGIFASNNLIGNQFTSIEVNDPSIIFYHTNLLPPEATDYVYTVSTSGAYSSNTEIQGFSSVYNGTDFIYAYPTDGYGLSASHRINTEGEQRITAL
jgi:hypothetical protein